MERGGGSVCVCVYEREREYVWCVCCWEHCSTHPSTPAYLHTHPTTHPLPPHPPTHLTQISNSLAHCSTTDLSYLARAIHIQGAWPPYIQPEVFVQALNRAIGMGMVPQVQSLLNGLKVLSTYVGGGIVCGERGRVCVCMVIHACTIQYMLVLYNTCLYYTIHACTIQKCVCVSTNTHT